MIVDGLPAGLALNAQVLNRDLALRQLGFGRSERMQLEKDTAVITAGVRTGKTTGAPVAVEIENRVFDNHKEIWDDPPPPPVTIPRPGHADLAGWSKFEGADIRDVIERASARETAAKVAAGAIAKTLLAEFGIRTGHKVRNIGGLVDPAPFDWKTSEHCCHSEMNSDDPKVAQGWKKTIAEAVLKGDSIGGRFECRIGHLPVGLGSYAQWDRKLDGRIAQAVMAIPGIKAVSFGDGFDADRIAGSDFRDLIVAKDGPTISRPTNHAGGLEGGLTNGEDLVVQAVMKPIPSVKVPGESVDLEQQASWPSRYERADNCVVHAAAVIAECAISLEIADALIDRFGGDTIAAMKAAFERDAQGLARWWKHE